jgi:tripartite-type tricarboxylate transporter receptor subunit TctC
MLYFVLTTNQRKGTPMTTRFVAMTIFVLGVALAPCAGLAQTPDYPTKPIRIITHAAPGSSPDINARILGERIGAALGQTVIVENRVGASGTLSLAAVAKAPPDGYTLGTITMSHAVAPALVARMPYDTTLDLAPVRQTTQGPLFLIVGTDAPWRTVSELIATAKAQPGRLTYASAGNATPLHLFGELFKSRTGTDILHIPYKGAVAATTALLGQQVDLLSSSGTAAVAHIRAGKMRALATASPQRSLVLPEVPTLDELGFSGFDVRDWQGIVAPAKTPRFIIDRLAAELAKAVTQPDVKTRLEHNGVEHVVDSSPEAFGTLIQSELARWTKTAREAGMRAD